MDDKNIVIERSLGGRRRWRFGGIASRFQMVVGLLGVLVCLLVVFGIGFLFGLWYQANEPIMPRDEAIALAEEQLKQLPELESSPPEMTFYSTLTTPETSEPPFPAESARPPTVAPLASAPDTSTRAMEETMMAAEGTAATPEAAGRAAPSAVTMPPHSAGPDATPPATQTPEAASQAPRTAAQPSGAAAEYYSVQVGSFRLAEQAQQLQQQLVEKGYAARLLLNLIPGNGVWYRVRVGKFNEREDADQVAQRLRAQESMEVLVMRESS
jgi:cell division protein FtsN